MKKTILVFIIYIVLSANIVFADTHAAADCERASVVTALGLAVAGDIVTVPAGTCTWASKIPIASGIIVQGNGAGSTIISGQGFSAADGVDDFRITGFTFNPDGSDYFIKIGTGNTTDNTGWRIDSNTFAECNGANIILTLGNTTGLIDNNNFTNGCSTSYISLAGPRDNAWTADTLLGTSDFVFVEDNTFTNNGNNLLHVISTGFGGRVVFRKNTITETSAGVNKISDWFDIHGYCHGSDERGGRVFEVYQNTFTRAYEGCCSGLYLRGGTGVVWGNTFDESGGRFWRSDYGGYAQIYLSEMRVPTNNTGSASCSVSCNASAACPTTEGGEGYPCCDQVGIGKNQASEPVYIWNNVDHLSASAKVAVESSDDAEYIQVNRDYYLSAKSGYSAYTYPHPLRGGTAYTLTVTKAGSGTGTVTSDFVGISCGEDCTEDYVGTVVTLTATATSPNYFVGWSGTGGCTGTSTCQLTMSAAKAATATFSRYGTATIGTGGSMTLGTGGSLTLQ